MSNTSLRPVDICSFKNIETHLMNQLNEDILILLSTYLNSKDKWSLLQASNIYLTTFSHSSTLLNRFQLRVDKENFKIIQENQSFSSVPFRNVSIFCDAIQLEMILNVLRTYENSIYKLTLNNLEYEETSYIFHNLKSLESLNFENCKVLNFVDDRLPLIPSLKSILFHECDGKFMKIFKNQKSIEKVVVRSHRTTWKGFSHSSFNELVENLSSFRHLVLQGDGASSYFDNEEFPFKIKILEATSITFNWYVGITNARINFLTSQKGFLKELKIEKLPLDFDGGRVLKFIIEEMKLEKFYYGKIPLILNGNKQQVVEFSSTETQIQAAFEMFRQFSSIKSFCLVLFSVDISSEDVEKIINSPTNLFGSLQEFKLIDNSQFRGLFGVFLGLFKNLKNIKKLTLETEDRNINVILEKCLPKMTKLEEIQLTSTAPKATERFKIIKKFIEGIKKLTIPVQFINDAYNVFGDNVEIYGI